MTQDATIFAFVWPFASTWMLLWGLAAAIPIIIHLLNRLRRREVTWAAMEYLLAAIKKRSRRIRIEQWLLLLTRALILLLLGLALADPILQSVTAVGQGKGGGQRTHWVLVIDGSYSMDYRDGEKSRFERAKELAAELIDESSTGDGFTLVMMSDPPQVIVRQVVFDPKDVRQEIDDLQLTHGGADLSTTLAEVEKIVQQTDSTRRRLKVHKVCIFSDLGQTTWSHVTEADCRSRLGRMAKKVSLVLFDVGQADKENLAITHLTSRPSLATIARPVNFSVEVQNFGSQDSTGSTVELLVDGETVGQESLDTEAGGRATVTFAHRFVTAGEHRVEARLASDRLEVDNHRWLSVPVRESIEVLCIGGMAGSARSVALALEPEKSNRPRIRPHLETENALLELDLNEYDGIFLCNVARFGRNEAAALHDYLRNGGGLVVFLGDRVDVESYNRELGDDKEGKRVLPAQLGNVISQAQYQFDTLDYRHPIVAPFRGFEQAGLRTTPVWKYFKLTPYDKKTAQVALAFEGGDPVIVEERILRGRSILVATAASDKSVDRSSVSPRPWTLLSAWPSFPPLVQEMLSVAVRGRGEGRNVEIGEGLEGWQSGADPRLTLTVIGPQEQDVGEKISVHVEGENSRWVYDDTFLSGIYETRLSDEEETSELFAVNVSTLESNLERFDVAMLPSQIVRDFQIDALDVSAPVNDGKFPLFQYVLAAVLMLLFLETLFAWRFGRAAA